MQLPGGLLVANEVEPTGEDPFYLFYDYLVGYLGSISLLGMRAGRDPPLAVTGLVIPATARELYPLG